MTVQEAMAAVKVAPRNPDAWVTLGGAFAEAGNEVKARKSYEEALKFDPAHVGALAGIAQLDQAVLPDWLDEPAATPAEPLSAPVVPGLQPPPLPSAPVPPWLQPPPPPSAPVPPATRLAKRMSDGPHVEQPRRAPARPDREAVLPPPPPIEAPRRSPLRDTHADTMDEALYRLTADGWYVVSQTATSAQVRKPRQWNTPLLMLSVVTPLLCGCASFVFIGPLTWACVPFGLVLLLVDYLVKKDKLVFFTLEDAQAGRLPL